MVDFIRTLIDGLAVGSLYALVALGYTMVYGILKFINFAHSDVFVLGAWVSFSSAMAAGLGGGDPAGVAPWVLYTLGVISLVGVGLFLWQAKRGDGFSRAVDGWGGMMCVVGILGWGAVGMILGAQLLHQAGYKVVAGGFVLVTAMLTCAAVGFTIERLAYKPLRKAPRINVLITAIGVSLLLQNTGQLEWVFGTSPRGMPVLLPDQVLFTLGASGVPGETAFNPGVSVRLLDVIGAGTAIILMIVLDYLVFRTKIGRALRAVSFNPSNAALMGIPVDRVISFTFMIGAMLAAAAGFLYSQKYTGLQQTAAAGWTLLGLKAFVAAVVGGIGNIRGAMLGGMLIGLLEQLGSAYMGPEYRDLYVFGLLILVLLLRPGGILGKNVVEKV